MMLTEWTTTAAVSKSGNSLTVNITKACRKMQINDGDVIVITIQKVSQ